MQQIQSHIDIEAPASLVWAILADFFDRYQRWNPLICGVLGQPRTGAQIEIKLRSSRGDELSVRATVQQCGKSASCAGASAGRCRACFRRSTASGSSRWRGGVSFHHGEQVQGIMVPLLTRRRRLRGQPEFDAMNIALKHGAERACESAAAAAR